MRTRGLEIIALACGLAACSFTLPVNGTMEDGLETFSGTTSGGGDRSGTLNIMSNKGLSCHGDWAYTSERTGRGIFICTNGLSGPFEFTSAGRHGNGVGRIGGRRFVFTFG